MTPRTNPNNPASIALADLTRITLPIGGSLSYTWAAKTGATTGNRTVLTRTVDANDGTDPHIWHYSYLAQGPVNGNLTQNTIVQDPLGNETVHVMTGLGGMFALYETQTQYFQGSHTGGSLLKTVTTDYQFTPNPWDLGMQSVTNVFPIRVTTTLPGGQVSKVETDYETALTYHGPLDGITFMICNPTQGPMMICNTSTNGVSNYTGSYGKAIATREYDYGASLPVRQTATSYQWQSGTNAAAYLANNFLDLVSSVTTRDGAGNQVAQTTYGYDENTLGSSNVSSLYLNGSPANGSFRGNRTSVHQWLNSPNTTLNSSMKYFDSGELQSSTDPGLHTTNHLYDLAYQGAYSTQTCSPTTSVAHCVSGTYDLNTGLLTSFTNENATNQASGNSQGDSAHTSTFTYDKMWRLILALAPPDVANSNARASTTFDYSVRNQVKRVKSLTNATSVTDYANFDGLGRTIQTRLVAPPCDSYVDTTYDVVGRVSTVSNPHCLTPGPTDGITTSIYDALGRVTQTTLQDGSISTTDYSQLPVVTVTDPAGHQRRSRTDALGRLVEVDEPGDPATFVANNYANLAVDGNFAVFGPANDIKWQTNTHGATNTFYSLNMQDDGNLIKYTPTWNTATPTTTGTASYGTMSCVGYRLFAGQTLASGACLQSLNKRFMLVMQTAGNLVQYDLSYSPAHAIFYNSTTGVAGSYLAMQGDGNLVIYTPSGTATWSTGTPTGSGNYMLQVQDPGNLVVYRDIWETGTSQAANGVTNFSGVSCSNIGNAIALNQNIPTGSCLISASGRFALNMQNDGNLAPLRPQRQPGGRHLEHRHRAYRSHRSLRKSSCRRCTSMTRSAICSAWNSTVMSQEPDAALRPHPTPQVPGACVALPMIRFRGC